MVPPEFVSVIDRHGGFTIESVMPHYMKRRYGIDKDAKKVDFYHSPLKIFNETLSEAEVHGDDVELKLRLDYDTTLEVVAELVRRG